MDTLADEQNVHIDPISHEAVSPDHAAAKSFYRSRMYYFVSKANKEVFEDNPALWISEQHGSVTSSSISPEDE